MHASVRVEHVVSRSSGVFFFRCFRLCSRPQRREKVVNLTRGLYTGLYAYIHYIYTYTYPNVLCASVRFSGRISMSTFICCRVPTVFSSGRQRATAITGARRRVRIGRRNDPPTRWTDVWGRSIVARSRNVVDCKN